MESIGCHTLPERSAQELRHEASSTAAPHMFSLLHFNAFKAELFSCGSSSQCRQSMKFFAVFD